VGTPRAFHERHSIQWRWSGCEDHNFRRSSEIDEHHGHFRFAWELVASDGSVAIAGLDAGELAENGRIARITGFFGDPPTVNAA
jgi:hypothetical protein